MPDRPPRLSADAFRAQFSQLTAELYAAANCGQWAGSMERFAEGLWRSADKRFGSAEPTPKDIESYLKSLHLEDLALACACAEGNDAAWEFFIAKFREDLRAAARAILRGAGVNDEARAMELADSLYADLYGIRGGTEGGRRPLFEYFHGRSKLSTWLRAVIAQRHVDMIRTSARTVSLEPDPEEEAPRTVLRAAEAPPRDPSRAKYIARFERAVSAALASLTPRERLLLASYYVDGQKLAQIGAMLREHESTVSRQLEHVRRTVRERVTEALGRAVPAQNGRGPEPGLDAAQIELVFEYGLEDWPFDLSRALSNAEPTRESSGE